MKKTLLIGENGSGKEILISILLGEPIKTHPSMAVEYYGSLINTPSEFLENKYFFTSLITASFDSEIILLVISDQHKTSLFPPKFVPLFNKVVIGVITQNDEFSGNNTRAKLFLNNAGVTDIMTVNIKTGEGVKQLKERLL